VPIAKKNLGFEMVSKEWETTDVLGGSGEGRASLYTASGNAGVAGERRVLSGAPFQRGKKDGNRTDFFPMDWWATSAEHPFVGK